MLFHEYGTDNMSKNLNFTDYLMRFGGRGGGVARAIRILRNSFVFGVVR